MVGETKECWIPGRENHTGRSSQSRKTMVAGAHERKGAWPELLSSRALEATLKILSLF